MGVFLFRTDKNKFYIVSKDILPEAILKTAKVKELLAKKEAETVNEAVEKVGLSRSAFYKYRDGVFPFYEASKEKIITITITLEHRSGILSNCLNSIAVVKGNILTINQGIPLQGVAYASISIDTVEMETNVEELLESLYKIPGVIKVEIVGQS
ncbi:MAG: chorismate mutase [Clostridia bacterium]|nr:chorismate mutase [Clostridia bacterium]MDN5322874.1 chorismate mutase [Clostridia bacterium]